MVPCNFTPSPDPECGPDADRRCRPPMPTGRRAERRPLLGEPRASQAGCDGQRLRPKILEMVLRTAIQVRSVCGTGKHVVQSTIRCAFTR